MVGDGAVLVELPGLIAGAAIRSSTVPCGTFAKVGSIAQVGRRVIRRGPGSGPLWRLGSPAPAGRGSFRAAAPFARPWLLPRRCSRRATAPPATPWVLQDCSSARPRLLPGRCSHRATAPLAGPRLLPRRCSSCQATAASRPLLPPGHGSSCHGHGSFRAAPPARPRLLPGRCFRQAAALPSTPWVLPGRCSSRTAAHVAAASGGDGAQHRAGVRLAAGRRYSRRGLWRGFAPMTCL